MRSLPAFLQKITTTTRSLRLSTAGICAALSITLAGPLSAHELLPAVADLTLESRKATMVIALSLEPLVAGIDLSEHSDSSDSPQAALYDELVALPAEDIAERFREAFPALRAGFDIQLNGKRLVPELDVIAVPDRSDTEGARISEIAVTFELPKGSEPLSVAWAPSYGPLILRFNADDGSEYNAFLTDGDRSADLERPKSGFFGRLFGN